MNLYFTALKKLDLELPWDIRFSKKVIYHKFILWDTFKERLKRSRIILFQEGATLTFVKYDKKRGRTLEERFRVKVGKPKAMGSQELSKRLVKFAGEHFLFPSHITLIKIAFTLKDGPKAKEFRSANSKAPFLYSFESDSSKILDVLSANLTDNGFKQTELPLYLSQIRPLPFTVRALAEERVSDFLARLEKSIDALKDIAEKTEDEEILKEIKRREKLALRIKTELPQGESLTTALPPVLKLLAENALKGRSKSKKRLKLYLKYLLPLEDLKALKGRGKKRLKALAGG